MRILRKNININKKIVSFLILCFCIPFICVLLIKIIPRPSVDFILFGLQAAAPSVAALLTVYWYSNKKGLKRFLSKCYRSNNIKRVILYSLIIIVFVFLVGLTAKVLYGRLTGWHKKIFAQIRIKQLVIILWALIAEELGWRGFLQEELKIKKKAFIPLIIGSVWALWHYHYYWIGRNKIPVVLFLTGCIAESYIYYFLMKQTNGNIIPVSVWHFMGNLVISLFAMIPDLNEGKILLYSIYTCLISICGILCFVKEFVFHGIRLTNNDGNII